MDIENHPFANSNIRVLLGLMSSLSIVVVAVFFIDNTITQALMIGAAAVDAVGTPYVLKRLVENATEETVGQQI
ncbi:hypothetical protein ACFQJ7_15875 [Halovenus rubra]|uniref:Uncharacterized protein n=2 Tax=Halovenus rubra TaxID=869890 RepID=A0ABD5X8G3_9EURY|nr:hypothetical protein [Halovenus rubra]